ncbi:hypothetical protein BWU74_30565 [Paraburkholderia caledonica]|nr:hypothetical protein BWU74_30565 [Burkholderia sp. Bk]
MRVGQTDRARIGRPLRKSIATRSAPAAHLPLECHPTGQNMTLNASTGRWNNATTTSSLIPNPENFPLHELPTVIHDAVVDACCNVQVTPSLAFMTVLATLSTACQDRFIMRRMKALTGPVNMYLFPQGASGARKTSVRTLVEKPLEEFEKRMTEQYRTQLNDYQARHNVWSIQHKAIQVEIKKLARRGSPLDDAGRRLLELQSQEPQKPLHVRFSYVDATPQAIARSMHENWPSAYVGADEGEQALSGLLSNSKALINGMWNGSAVHVDRASSESFSILSPRLTLFVMSQPGVFDRYMQTHGAEARDIGLLARGLFCRPYSIQGSRFIRKEVPSSRGMSAFHDAVLHILERGNYNLEERENSRVTLEFDDDAQARWIDIFNIVESQVGQGGALAHVADFASKYAENVARMAALFHASELQEGKVTLDTLNRAATVCQFFAREFEHLMEAVQEIPAEVRHASKLEQWLFERVWRAGNFWVDRTYVANYCPNGIRKSRLDAALFVLAERGAVRLDTQLRRSRTGRNVEAKVVILNPNYFQTYVLPSTGPCTQGGAF